MAFAPDIEGLARRAGFWGGLAVATQMATEVSVRAVKRHGYAAVLALFDVTAFRAKHSRVEAPPVQE